MPHNRFSGILVICGALEGILSRIVRGLASIGCLMLVVIWSGRSVQAEIVSQENFDSGQVGVWSPFATPNGTLGGEGFPVFVNCDAAGTGHISRCWQVKVGQIQYSPDQDLQQGGGLEIRQALAPGWLKLSVFVMVTYASQNDRRNLAGGLFEWIIDHQVMGRHEIGPIENGATIRHHFTADIPVEAGSHLIQLRMSRPFTSGAGRQAPLQFIDDLALDWSPR